MQGPEYLQTKTDAEGRYSFKTVNKPGDFRIAIKSSQWVGLTDYQKLPRLKLNSESAVERDFTLPRAAQIQIRAVDEEGAPVRGVSVYIASLADVDYRNTDSRSTDGTGWAILGGLKPQAAKYIIGLQHKDYAFEKLIRKVEKVETSEVLTVTMRAGETVAGKAICSDGKPPAGWRILAMPAWWHYGVSPRGLEVKDDGSFELKHVVPGEYKVTPETNRIL